MADPDETAPQAPPVPGDANDDYERTLSQHKPAAAPPPPGPASEPAADSAEEPPDPAAQPSSP